MGNENLLAKMYSGRIVIPQPVYEELSYPGISHLKARVDTLIISEQAKIEAITVGTDTYDLYERLTFLPEKGHVIIGKGEAASIALAKKQDGIVASNNLRDIRPYIEEFHLKHMTTGDILLEALEKSYITEEQGNTLWAAMLAKRRKLGTATFTDYRKVRLKMK